MGESTDANHIAASCVHGTSTIEIAGLAASVVEEDDADGSSAYIWRAANQAISLIVTLSISIQAGTLDNYRSIYNHILSSIQLASHYAHTPAS